MATESASHRDPETLRRLYHGEGMSTREMAEELGVSSGTVSRWLKKHEIDTRENTFQRPPHRRGYDVSREELKELYWSDWLSLREVGDEYGVSAETVRRWFRIYGISTRTDYMAWEPAPFRTHPLGYEQWRNHNESGHQSVYVHRLLAVAEYGFDAVCDNHVHHLDGVKWDNRAENIEILSPSEHARLHASEDIAAACEVFDGNAPLEEILDE